VSYLWANLSLSSCTQTDYKKNFEIQFKLWNKICKSVEEEVEENKPKIDLQLTVTNQTHTVVARMNVVDPAQKSHNRVPISLMS
jgi:hypothetical protein